MKHSILIPLLAILTSCSQMQPKEIKDIEDYTVDDILRDKEPSWSSSGSNDKEKTNSSAYLTPLPQYYAPLERKAGSLSFEEWKKAKEANSQEYQDYLEYREYLQTIQSVPAPE